jgi:ATP-binding cassette subfamily F protein 3
VLRLADCALTATKGNWDTLQRERADRKKFTDRLAAEQEKSQARLLASIDASLRSAGADDKLRKLLASRREKALERGSGMMRDSKGHRFRRNADENAGYHLTLLNAVEVVAEEKPVHFHFEAPALGRGGGAGAGAATLLAVDGLAFRYPGCSGSAPGFGVELPDLHLSAGERLVLLGPNGHGKSTLLRLLAGELVPARGTARTAAAAVVGYYDQHAVDRLGSVRLPALEYVVATRRAAGLAGRDEEAAVRRVLGAFGLGAHAGTPVALLSGGQRVALEFALLALRRPALLLLDEPSAHLDLQAREGLAAALAGFTEGAVLFISHDIGFIELAAPTRALVCKGGRFKPVDAEGWKRAALAL